MTDHFTPLPDPLPALRSVALYFGDNGRCFCGRLHCAGMNAHYTGRDLSGQRVERITALEHDLDEPVGDRLAQPRVLQTHLQLMHPGVLLGPAWRSRRRIVGAERRPEVVPGCESAIRGAPLGRSILGPLRVGQVFNRILLRRRRLRAAGRRVRDRRAVP